MFGTWKFGREALRRSAPFAAVALGASAALGGCSTSGHTLADVAGPQGPWAVTASPCDVVFPGSSSAEERKQTCATGALPDGDDAKYDVVRAQVEAYVDSRIDDVVCAEVVANGYTCAFFAKKGNGEWENLYVVMTTGESEAAGGAGRDIAYFEVGQSPEDGRDALEQGGVKELP